MKLFSRLQFGRNLTFLHRFGFARKIKLHETDINQEGINDFNSKKSILMNEEVLKEFDNKHTNIEKKSLKIPKHKILPIENEEEPGEDNNEMFEEPKLAIDEEKELKRIQKMSKESNNKKFKENTEKRPFENKSKKVEPENEDDLDFEEDLEKEENTHQQNRHEKRPRFNDIQDSGRERPNRNFNQERRGSNDRERSFDNNKGNFDTNFKKPFNNNRPSFDDQKGDYKNNRYQNSEGGYNSRGNNNFSNNSGYNNRNSDRNEAYKGYNKNPDQGYNSYQKSGNDYDNTRKFSENRSPSGTFTENRDRSSYNDSRNEKRNYQSDQRPNKYSNFNQDRPPREYKKKQNFDNEESFGTQKQGEFNDFKNKNEMKESSSGASFRNSNQNNRYEGEYQKNRPSNSRFSDRLETADVSRFPGKNFQGGNKFEKTNVNSDKSFQDVDKPKYQKEYKKFEKQDGENKPKKSWKEKTFESKPEKKNDEDEN